MTRRHDLLINFSFLAAFAACLAWALAVPQIKAQSPSMPQPVTYAEHLDRANALFKAGNLPDALSAVQAAAKLDGRRYEAPALAALILQAAGKSAEAQAAIVEALRLAPADRQAKLRDVAKLIGQPGPVAGAPSAPAAGSLANPDAFTGAVRRKYHALLLIVEEADKAKDDERTKLLAEYLEKSEAFVREQPRVLAIWMLRAMAALELNRAKDGWEAGQQLVKLGADDSPDAKLGKLLAMLDRKGWMGDEPPAQRVAPAEISQGTPGGKGLEISDLNLTMQPIAAGDFTMGDVTTHQVSLTKPFWLGKTEVTQAQWTAVMGGNPSEFKGDSLPVERVNWDEAMDFCRKLTERERAAGRLPKGYAYTLPTEAQWEYACRAGTIETNSSRSELTQTQAIIIGIVQQVIPGVDPGSVESMGWYDSNSGKTTHLVGQKQANAWGLYDMHGNVWEWCRDWYGDYPGGSVSDPTGAASGSSRVYRGGAWNSAAVRCRFANRERGATGSRYNDLGFRLALSSVR